MRYVLAVMLAVGQAVGLALSLAACPSTSTPHTPPTIIIHKP